MNTKKIYKRHLLILTLYCLTVFFVTGTLAQPNAATNTDAVVDDANQITNHYTQQKNPTAPPLIIQEGWRAQLLREPVWNSNIYVLEAGLDNQQSIILIHGLGGLGLQDWQGLIPSLAREYHVIAFDLPGFARSERPPGKYSPDNYAKVVAWLAQELAHGPVIPVGHSMGGAIAVEYTARYPSQVERVVLVSAAGILERRALVENATETSINSIGLPGPIGDLATKIGQIGRRALEWISVPPDPSPALDAIDPIWVTLFGNYPMVNAAYALSLHNFVQPVAMFNKPVTIIWGSSDAIAPIRTGKMLDQMLPNSNLVVIEDASHAPMHSHPSLFELQLLEALRGNVQVPPPQIPMAYQGNLRCQNSNGVNYSGQYDEIELIGCTNINLTNVSATRIILRNSLAYFENVSVANPDGTALSLENSFVSATNSEFKGAIAVFATGSRLDFANVTLQSPNRALRFEQQSRVVASLSNIQSGVYQGSLHGLYDEQNVWIDERLSRRR